MNCSFVVSWATKRYTCAVLYAQHIDNVNIYTMNCSFVSSEAAQLRTSQRQQHRDSFHGLCVGTALAHVPPLPEGVVGGTRANAVPTQSPQLNTKATIQLTPLRGREL